MVFVPPHSDRIHWIRQKRLSHFAGGTSTTRSVPTCSSIKQSLNARLPLTQYVWCELLNHQQEMQKLKVTFWLLKLFFWSKARQGGSSVSDSFSGSYVVFVCQTSRLEGALRKKESWEKRNLEKKRNFECVNSDFWDSRLEPGNWQILTDQPLWGVIENLNSQIFEMFEWWSIHLDLMKRLVHVEENKSELPLQLWLWWNLFSRQNVWNDNGAILAAT